MSTTKSTVYVLEFPFDMTLEQAIASVPALASRPLAARMCVPHSLFVPASFVPHSQSSHAGEEGGVKKGPGEDDFLEDGDWDNSLAGAFLSFSTTMSTTKSTVSTSQSPSLR